jgi:hypothetical protein
MGPWTREKIENWAADFCGGEAARRFDSGAREYAGQVLTTLLVRACEARGIEPEDVEEADLRAGLLEGVAPLELPASVRHAVPDLAAAFLEDLEREGRLAAGRALGLFVRALRQPFLDAAGGTRRPDRRPAPKIGPNDPCPCGSGRKFKKCCKGLV